MTDEPEHAPAAPADEPIPPGANKSTGRLYGGDMPLYRTAAEVAGLKAPSTTATPGLSQSPGLYEIEGSEVPGLPGGGMVRHVMGPGQAPVDPIAAGLDMGHNPQTRNENRVISQTGTIGSGNRPSTYAEKGHDPAPLPADHSLVAAPADPTGKPATPPAT